MFQPADILSVAARQPIMVDQMTLIENKDQHMPGSIQYSLKRYHKQIEWDIEEAGMMVYQYQENNPVDNYLELRFCMIGKTYCTHNEANCHKCKFITKKNGATEIEAINVLNIRFAPAHLTQLVRPLRTTPSISNDILAFEYKTSFTKILSLCGRIRLVLEGLLNNTYVDSLANIYVNAQTQMLLLYSMECMLGEKNLGAFTCKFLANEADRDKIIKARAILLENLSEPITIKELSRKVAINECYLKKGFKEMFGATIFDFYQSQRMEHARYLLYEKGLSVTDVSMMLGYSSISHFSTAFKKHTGLKPCELLLH